tara:strand:+ start:47 stop:754 length:708 start_codon:yes stop_codon:yes gene_type:complete
MIEMLYYLAGVSVVGTIGFGLFYLYDEQTATAIMEDFSWSAVRAYHRVNMETNNLRRYLENEFSEGKNSDVEEDDESAIDEEEKLVSFLGYNNDGSRYTTDELENNDYIDDENFSMMMLVKKDEEEKLYKRIHEKGEISSEVVFEKVPKPFLSVEVEQNNNRIAIHDQLKGFYINGNMLLDKVFLKWYLEEFYGMNLEDDYKIHIIDSNIEMHKIQFDQSVTIQSKEQLYSITQV